MCTSTYVKTLRLTFSINNHVITGYTGLTNYMFSSGGFRGLEFPFFSGGPMVLEPPFRAMHLNKDIKLNPPDSSWVGNPSFQNGWIRPYQNKKCKICIFCLATVVSVVLFHCLKFLVLYMLHIFIYIFMIFSKYPLFVLYNKW